MTFLRILTASLICALASHAKSVTFSEQGSTRLDSLLVSAQSGSFADIDNDGDIDLLVQGAVNARRLFRNNIIGTGSTAFTNITSTHGPVASDTVGWSAAWGDYDGDGDVDVFLGETNTGSSRGDLFRNDGASGFTDVSASTINDPGFHQNVAWCDIDRDLDLDLIIAMEGPELHQIYIQGPAGIFTASGAAANFQQPYGTKAYGMAIGDTDGDRDADIYISTCIAGGNIRNNFYRNQKVPTGTLTFVDIADTNGTQYMDNSYHAEFQDFDDDADLDLFMVGADGKKSKIWRNNGSNSFTDIDTITGGVLFPNTGMDLNGGKAVDYDNDGDLDLFAHDHLASVTTNSARLLYRNDGNWQFTNVTAAVGLSATNEGGYDSAWGDVDNDGDQDLFCATSSSFRERLFISDASTNGNKWLYVRLRGPASNTTAIGAQLYATIHKNTPQQKTLRRDANSNAGTFNQSDVPVHFGLGSATQVDELRIVWPNDAEQTLTNIAANQYLSINIPAASVSDWKIY